MNKTIEKELNYGANIYSSLPVVFHRANGSFLYDTNDKEYIEILESGQELILTSCKRIKKIKIKEVFNEN